MGIVKQGRPKVYRPGDVKPPPKPALYNIFDPKGKLLYSGETSNVGRRASEHERSGVLPTSGTLTYQEVDGRSTSRTRREIEKQRIEQNTPPLNKSTGGEGRPAN